MTRGARPRLSRRQVLAGGAGALALAQFIPTSCRARQAPPPALSLADFGAVGNGVADDGPALARALAEARRQNLSLLVPAGTFLILDAFIFGGGAPFAPHRGIVIHGIGAASVLRFRKANFPAFYGFTLEEDDIEIRDLTLEVDRGGSGWTAAASVVRSLRNLRFTRMLFRGLGGRTGHYGLMPANADIAGLVFDQCRFEGLEFGYFKETSDISTQTGIAISNCTGHDCTEVFEFNSPGLFRGDTRAGSALVTRIAGDDGGAFDATRLRVGEPVRSPLFPDGTKLVSIANASQITLSAAALATSPADNKGRFSAGGCRGGVIQNFRASDIGQWALGFAHCEDWQVEAYGEDIGYELVHVEDGCRGFRITAGGRRCNLSRGVVGSPGADNGMVHIQGGSRDIAILFRNADLRANREAAPNGLCVHAGGVMGTTGLVIDPGGITVGGSILLEAGTRAVLVDGGDIRFADLELVNPDPRSRSDPMMRLRGCRWSGSIRVHNPGTLVEGDRRPNAGFDRVTVMP